ncbi:beta-ketoacyl synthase N-terminal-like domain-containing protein [Paraglaciecola sp.]|uniref:polyketide synthase family protein n=1 Tax=Paraglaciecola sp. TaxID=1920173 RepID=UPI0030F411BF
MQPIAVVGMGCLFPEAISPKQYFENLLEGKDVTGPLCDDLLDAPVDAYFDATKGTQDKICYNTNGYIRNFEFDTCGYALDENKLRGLDPLFHWSLYAADQAFKDANQTQEARAKCGLILGNIGMPNHTGKKIMNGFYQKILEPYIQELLGNTNFKFDKYWANTPRDKDNLSVASLNATIASEAMQLGGPSFTLDAACSSALYAMKVAADYLTSGKANMMLAGAVCHADRIYIAHGFNILQAFPEIDAHSVPFDRSSQGLKAGEGAGVVALKRLDDAVKNGDRIYGVIESIGLSNDGGAKHILVPDSGGQLVALERAYGKLDNKVDYLECHATGTPVGDQVELNTIESFFSKRGQIPKLGANKGNIGHMLTASGMASIIKVLQSLNHNVIPATIQLNDMVKTKAGKLDISHVVRENTDWPKRNEPRRAGINAFGFGGVNGHMVIRDFDRMQDAVTDSQPVSQESNQEPLAIIGMAVAMAHTHTPAQFNQVIQQGDQAFVELPATRWSGIEKRPDILQEFGLNGAPKGSYIEKFEFDCRRFKLPPNVAGIHLLSHMSLMQLAATAFYDAGFEVDDKRNNIAVIVATDNDYMCYRYQARNEAAWQVRDSLKKSNISLTQAQTSELERIVKDSIFPEPYAEGITGGINNVVASRISATLKLNGPSFTISAQENSVYRAVELAQFLLTLDDIDTVMIGSGSFCGGLEDVLFRQQSHQSADPAASGLSFEEQSTGYNVGEGGGVIVLRNLQKAQQENNQSYAAIDALAFSQTPSSSAPNQIHQHCLQTINKALKQAHVDADDVNYVECSATGNPLTDAQELSLLNDVYSGKTQGGSTVLGSVKSSFGHLSAASGMASIIKTALCLNQQYLPPTPNWRKFKPDYETLSDGLKVITSKEVWNNSKQGKRVAALGGFGLDNFFSHMLMSSVPDTLNRKALVDLDMAKIRKGSLIKNIYIGREHTIREMIVSDENRRKLGIVIPEKEELTQLKMQVTAPQKVVADSNQQITRSLSLYSLKQQAVTSLEQTRERERLRSEQTHLSFLKTEQLFYQSLQQLALASNEFSHVSHVSEPAAGPSLSQVIPINDNVLTISPNRQNQAIRPCIYDYADLLEMTTGKVANVLGEWYKEVDNYPVRTRMPSPPYMFVSRITRITAEREKLQPCVIEWEYDLKEDDWFVYHGLVPAFVSLESSHAMIVAFTLIGCDKLFKGELKYRAIDSKTTIHSEMPKAGEILKGKVQIEGFTKVGKMILIKYIFDGYVSDRHSFTLTATSGFFPQKEIEKAKGLSTKKLFANIEKLPAFTPFLKCSKNAFTDRDLLAVQAGDLEACFGSGWGNAMSPGLYAEKAKMLDRILSVDRVGGAWGLGQMLGEVDVRKSHWAFMAHFKNDPVLPGTLIVEGAEQMVRFYLYYIGLHTQTQLQPTLLKDHSYSAKFRGEVKYADEPLQYRMSIKQIRTARRTDDSGHSNVDEFDILFIVETIYRDQVIGVSDNLGARFVRSLPHLDKENR